MFKNAREPRSSSHGKMKTIKIKGKIYRHSRKRKA